MSVLSARRRFFVFFCGVSGIGNSDFCFLSGERQPLLSSSMFNVLGLGDARRRRKESDVTERFEGFVKVCTIYADDKQKKINQR